MIRPTPDDYRAAQEILLNQHEIYSFRGPWLEREKETERQPATEAALIDILLSHDNEGDRVMFTGHFPKSTTRLQERLHYIRRHTDPDFLRNEVYEARRSKAEFAFLTEYSVMPRTAEHIENARYGSLAAIDGALQSLEMLKERFPGLKSLNRHEDRGDVFKEMALSTGLYDQDLKVNTEFNEAAHFMAVDCWDYDDRYILAAVMPLLREKEMDELARTAAIIMEAHDLYDAEKKFPRIGALLEAYGDRCEAMARERPGLETRLAEFNTASLPGGNAIRQSEVFEKFDWLGMFVDPSLLDLVKRITAEAQEAPPASAYGRRSRIAALRR